MAIQLPQLPTIRVDDQATQIGLSKIVDVLRAVYAFLTGASGAWQDPTLSTQFTNKGGAYARAAYRQDFFGRVTVKGALLCTPGAAAQTTIFTLPVGYRPKETLTFVGDTSNAFQDFAVDQYGNVAVGNITIGAGLSTFFSFSFLAEQ